MLSGCSLTLLTLTLTLTLALALTLTLTLTRFVAMQSASVSSAFSVDEMRAIFDKVYKYYE